MRKHTFERGRAVLVVAALMTLAACGGGDKKAEEKAKAEAAARGGQTVTAATATLADLPRSVIASGSVSAWEEVPVGAETGGLVATAVYVDEGTYVRQGQPLVQLNDALLRAQLRQQQASVQTAQANAARDDAALARAQELKERGFLSQASLDNALADQRASRANLASAQASLSETQTRLSQATIRAPVAGLIISRSVTRGQIVAAGTELFRMVRDGRLELDAQVPEAELPLVRAGQSAGITADQATGPVSGRVRIVTPEVDPQTRLGVARVALNPGSGLRPGMFARATIDVGAAPALTVPAQSVVFRDGKAGVYVIGANNVVHFNQVTTGDRAGPNVVIAAGIPAGSRVVVQGAGFLGDGDRVTVSTRAPAAVAAPAPAAR
ncbi:RND transporter [Brevundimonas sp. Leaf363]|uniref:efflux RND transporter periplasmic adaptor subunit n=1 Tax=Brevundimonas sp. Leaf363 TaxID=1736353 RepID=UPI0006FCF841|nr:efflux RND transporter periplasmic adaptor subunit [Brevundimonas sp. Leaf363]KQS53903.1 RND transporter [Brevundimonas sp. Leaf363]